MKKVTLADGKRFRLISYGNGLAYSLEDKGTGRSVFLQGDDAAAFRSELETLETAHPDWDTDLILAEAWEPYDAISRETRDEPIPPPRP